MNEKVRNFFSNIAYAFVAQGISLLLSFTISLLVPKFIGVIQFGYWQLFLFYISYACLFHLGFNDGIYLRNGGKKYNDLDFVWIAAKSRIALISQVLIAVVIICISVAVKNTADRKFILVVSAIYMVFNNRNTFYQQVFQTVNNTKTSSLSMTIEKVFYMLCIIFILLFRFNDFKIFIILYIVAKMVSVAYCVFHGKEITFAKIPLSVYNKDLFEDYTKDLTVGINLTISFIAGSLILGVGQFVIDGIWGIETFGKLSLSLSMTNFFLVFIMQISLVLFPELSRINLERLYGFYTVVRDFLGILLPAVFLFYLPIRLILGWWLPQYVESLKYLALLLPICTFDGKMQILGNTYLKVLRKEKILLLLNLISLAVCTTLSFISGYIFHSMYAILISMVFAIAIRNILCEIYIGRLLNVHTIKNIIGEILLVLIFELCTWLFSSLAGFLTFSVVYGLYLWLSKNKIKAIISSAKNLLNRSKA